MIEQAGNFSLVAAFLAALVGVAAGVAGWRLRDAAWTKAARACVVLFVPLVLVSCVALLAALANSDMRFAYVATHTERSLPIGYKLVAFWAGQEGSLLLWATVLGVMSAMAAVGRRRLKAAGEPVTLGLLSAANLFFAALMLFAANPFALSPGGAPPDGHGLNPQLQHWAMVLHPPMLFLGYAGFTIPFAIMLGALAAGTDANGWAGQMRRWVIASWLFLGAGIVLGAWWAYVELGWGGYWAWDPVENASLLPWLTGTALLHSLVIHRQRHTFRVWTASLTAVTFVLCIFGTYITRSGVIESIHAFGASAVGTFFLVLILVSGAVALGAILWRLPTLRSPARVESLLSRDSMFVLTNVILLLMTAVTLVGTVYPLLSDIFLTKPVSVGQDYYNRAMAPMALALGAIMALGPLLVHGRNAAESVRSGVVYPGIVTGAAVIVAALLGLSNLTALFCVAIGTMTVSVIALTFARSLRQQVRLRQRGWLTGALHLIDANHRRYGGQLAHTGVVLLFIGIAGSNIFSQSKTVSMQPDETVRVGAYELEYQSIREFRGPNYTAVEAQIQMRTAGGRTVDLRPQSRFYDKAENASTEVALRSGLAEDLYVALVGWQDGGKTISVQAMVNPLTMWVWIGSATILAGGVFCVLPRIVARRGAPVAAPVRDRAGTATRPEIAPAPPEPVGAH